MSTPLFIQTPTFGNAIENGPVVGVSCADLTSCTVLDRTAIVTEPTLIEEVLWSLVDFSTDAGELVLFAKNNGGQRHVIGTYPIPAGTSTQQASGRIPVNVVLPVGYKLGCAHTVQKSASFVNMFVLPLAGAIA